MQNFYQVGNYYGFVFIHGYKQNTNEVDPFIREYPGNNLVKFVEIKTLRLISATLGKTGENKDILFLKYVDSGGVIWISHINEENVYNEVKIDTHQKDFDLDTEIKKGYPFFGVEINSLLKYLNEDTEGKDLSVTGEQYLNMLDKIIAESLQTGILTKISYEGRIIRSYYKVELYNVARYEVSEKF